MNTESLLEDVGFVAEYQTEFIEFYRQFFENEESLYTFFQSVFQRDNIDKRPRWMLNDILRFVSLARDIEKIRPGRDPLKILFFRICLESICKDSGSKNKEFFDTFDACFSEEGKQYILSHFVFSGIDVPNELIGIDRARFDTHEGYQLTCSDFLYIIKATRGMVAHDGDYWSMQFFARDNDSTWLTEITTDEQVISCQPAKKRKELTYRFQTTMQYNRFEHYFVEACINYLWNYIEGQRVDKC